MIKQNKLRKRQRPKSKDKRETYNQRLLGYKFVRKGLDRNKKKIKDIIALDLELGDI